MLDKTTIIVALLIASLLAGLFSRYILGTESPKECMSCSGKEHFMQQTAGSPIDGSLESPLWSSSPAPTPLKSYELANDSELFEFQNTPMKPECCPSTITGSGGCACLTDEQKKKFATRGGNRAAL